MAATAEQMEKIQETLAKILEQNASLVKEVELLKKDNEMLKRNESAKEARIMENKAEWSDAEEAAFKITQKLADVKEELKKDGVAEEFFTEETKIGDLCKLMRDIGGDKSSKETEELAQEMYPQEPFDNNAREEKMNCYFGEENNFTPVAMRRFVERYKTIKKMNTQLRITGWDNKQYRAGKIKLCLKGMAFDYIEFACVMEEEWAEDDEKLLERLQDKFINVQAIEMNILKFEQSVQEPRETIAEFLGRLKRAVREAYDGDSQLELDRKVAWRFVSGLSDKHVRDKLIDGGWMKNRQAAKELDELQRIAEHTKRNEDTSKALNRNSGQIALLEDRSWEGEQDTIASFRSGSSGGRSKTNSTQSSSSREAGSSRVTTPEQLSENFECYYCKTKSHRGGWYHCPKRRKENPNWKPKKMENSKTRKDFQ